MPTDTKIRGCSSPSCKAAGIVFACNLTHPPIYFKASLGYLQHLIQCKCCVVIILYHLRTVFTVTRKKNLYVFVHNRPGYIVHIGSNVTFLVLTLLSWGLVSPWVWKQRIVWVAGTPRSLRMDIPGLQSWLWKDLHTFQSDREITCSSMFSEVNALRKGGGCPSIPRENHALLFPLCSPLQALALSALWVLRGRSLPQFPHL